MGRFLRFLHFKLLQLTWYLTACLADVPMEVSYTVYGFTKSSKYISNSGTSFNFGDINIRSPLTDI